MFTSPHVNSSLIYVFLFLLNLLYVHSYARNLHLNSTTHQRIRRARCGRSCRFSICTAGPPMNGPTRDPFIILGPPRTAFNRFICLADESNPVLPPITTADPAILDGNSLIPLSRWRPAGLSRPFVRRFFRARQLIPGPRLQYGIAPEPSQGNQWSFLHNRCVVLRLRRFTIEDSNGNLVTKSGGASDCVAFETRAPTLHAFMVWESDGDGDIVLQEPSLDVVDFLNPRLPSGARLNGDNGVGTCNVPDFNGYTESIMYFPGRQPPSGAYVAEAWQGSDCGRSNSRTDWSLRIVRNGTVDTREIQTGTVTANGNYTRAGDVVFAF